MTVMMARRDARSRAVRAARVAAVPLLALLVAGVVLFLASRRVERGDVHAALIAVGSPGWLLVAGMALVVFFTADAASLVVLARALRPGVSRLRTAGVVLESKLVEGATSFGGLEIPYQVVRLRGLGLDGPGASSIVLIRGLIHVSLVVCLAVICLLPGVPSPITALQKRLVLLAVALVAVVWVSLWATFGRSRGFGLLPGALAGRLQGFGEALRLVRTTNVRVVGAVVLLQTLTWAATFSLVPCILLSLGWRGELLPLILGQALFPLFTSFSPLPGGAGMAEVGYLSIVGGSLSPAVALASLVLWRLCTWVFPTLVGAVALGVRHLGSRRLVEPQSAAVESAV